MKFLSKYKISFLNKKFYIFFIILIIFIGIYFILNKPDCQKIECLSFNDSINYKIKNIYEESKYIFRGIYNNGDILLRAEIRPESSLEETNQAISFQKARTSGVFEDAVAPYPGEVSNMISCSEEYKPKFSINIINGLSISSFKSFLNERLVSGSCTSDQAIYHSNLSIFFCPKQKKMYQFELIIPISEYNLNTQKYESIINSISCKD